MRLRISILMLSTLLVVGAACSKNSQSGDNSSQPGDNSAQPGDDSTSANSSPSQSEPRHEAVIVTVPAGKVVTVRLADAVGSKISQAGQSFGGSLAKSVQVGGEVVVPAGAKVEGVVVDAKPLGRFAGGALLQLRLNSISVNGDPMPVQTATFTQTLKGKGKRTAVMAGGGAGAGALIGGLLGGGKGALIGGAAGAGAGTAGTAFTGNKEIVLPAESAVAFTLKEPLKIRK
jgi:hypothetical protein